MVEHDDFLGCVLDKLAANLAADRACGTSDKNYLVGHLADDVDVVEVDGFAFQQVFNLDVLDLISGEAVVNPCIDMWNGLDGESEIKPLVHDGLFALEFDSGDGDEEYFDIVLFDVVGIKGSFWEECAYAVEGGVGLFVVVV